MFRKFIVWGILSLLIFVISASAIVAEDKKTDLREEVSVIQKRIDEGKLPLLDLKALGEGKASPPKDFKGISSVEEGVVLGNTIYKQLLIRFLRDATTRTALQPTEAPVDEKVVDALAQLCLINGEFGRNFREKYDAGDRKIKVAHAAYFFTLNTLLHFSSVDKLDYPGWDKATDFERNLGKRSHDRVRDALQKLLVRKWNGLVDDFEPFLAKGSYPLYR